MPPPLLAMPVSRNRAFVPAAASIAMAILADAKVPQGMPCDSTSKASFVPAVQTFGGTTLQAFPDVSMPGYVPSVNGKNADCLCSLLVAAQQICSGSQDGSFNTSSAPSPFAHKATQSTSPQNAIARCQRSRRDMHTFKEEVSSCR